MNTNKHLFKINSLLLSTLQIGIIFYLAGFFLLTGNKQNTSLYIIAFIPLLALLPSTVKEIIPKHIIIYILIAGIAYYCISSFWSSHPGGAFLKSSRYALYIIAYLASLQILLKNNKLPISHITLTIFLSALISGTLTLFQQWDSIGSGRLMHSALIGGVRDNPINTAVFFGLASITSIHTFRTTDKKYFQAISLLALILFFSLILLTKSRGPIIALLITIPTMLIVIKGRTKTADIIKIGGFLVLIASLCVIYYDPIGNRFSQPNYRVEIWLAALKQLQGSLFFGTGLNFNDRITISDTLSFTHAHNSFIQLLVTGGVFGASIFLTILFFAIVTAWRSKDNIIKFYAIWLIYGCLCLSTNGKLLIHRPSSTWFSFWTPLFLVLLTHINSLDSSKYKHFLSFDTYLKWQNNKDGPRELFRKASDFWMGLRAWLFIKRDASIKPNHCDVLVVYRRETSVSKGNRLIKLLSEKYIVQETYLLKRKNILKKSFITNPPFLVPSRSYIYACYAWFLIKKFQPKIILTEANGSPLSPFLRVAANQIGSYVVHLAHSVPTDNYRQFSLIDFDYYFVYGKSSIDKLSSRKVLFGETTFIESGSLSIEERLRNEGVSSNQTEDAILLLGSGPNIEKQADVEEAYRIVINWALQQQNFTLYFKPHPRSNCNLWHKLVLELNAKECTTIVNNLGINLSHCIASVAAYTNAILDSSLLCIPPIWLTTADAIDEFSIEKLIGPRVLNSDQLRQRLTDYLNSPELYKKKTDIFIKYHLAQENGQSINYMMEQLETILCKSKALPL